MGIVLIDRELLANHGKRGNSAFCLHSDLTLIELAVLSIDLKLSQCLISINDSKPWGFSYIQPDFSKNARKQI